MLSEALKNKIESYVLSIRDNNDRSQAYFHPSTVGFCPRKTVMERLSVKKPPHDARLQAVFENGHAVHERLQRWLKESGIMVQEEFPVASPEHNMKGHTDGIGCLYIPDVGGVMVVLEIKSCSAKSWSWIFGDGKWKGHGPDKKHIWQVQLYMYMTGCQYALIIYECKDNQKLDSFVIRRDQELIDKVLLPRVDLVNEHVAKKTLPPRDEEHLDPNPETGKTPFECQYCDYYKPCNAEERKRLDNTVLEGEIDLIALGEQMMESP